MSILFFIVLSVHFLNTPIIQEKNFYYILKPGTNAVTLTRDLLKQTQLKSSTLFLLLTKLFHNGKYLRAGEYIFPVGSKPLDIICKMVAGKVVYHKFTIVEGWTYKDLMKAMRQIDSVQHVLQNDSDRVIAKKLGLNQPTLEGLLLPDTYYYTRDTTDLEILRWAHHAMKDYLNKAWINRNKDCGYKNPYQALIIASMIEKETAVKEEKPLIAAVILKRLRNGMPLQIDATVIYGLQENYDGNLTKKDLHTKNLYNTYMQQGLPKTPISMPDRDSIQAALHPAKTDVLYFVARGDGTHEFSKTLKQHNKVVRKYFKH